MSRRKLSICERRELRLVSGADEADAIYNLKAEIEDEWYGQLTEFKQWQIAELHDYKREDIAGLTQTLRDTHSVKLMRGSRLFAVTVHYEVSVYVEFQPSTHDTGLAGESGVSVASNSQREGEGSTEGGF